jgi:hypothetical protein
MMYIWYIYVSTGFAAHTPCHVGAGLRRKSNHRSASLPSHDDDDSVLMLLFEDN